MRLQLILSLVTLVLVINTAATANDSLSATPTKAALVVPSVSDSDVSADLVGFLDAREKLCPDCWKNELYSYRARNVDSRFLRAMGSRWDDKTRLGVVFGSQDVRYGLWADVREINNVTDENQGYFSTISTVQNPGGGVDSFVSLNNGGELGSANGALALNSDRGAGNNFGATISPAPFAVTPAAPGNFGGNSARANFSSNPSQRSSQGSSDFSYTEYIAGLFVARSF